ncbi:hypothetical protein HDA32_003417 [Spinactinospora alkalitolerans]|uniref:Uncharacterized protein n=1 Tax=Spinactinospora alkalitolerans TaxID=687207 RepID=A0A852TYD5_9ACTN|nr:hypothetical protein [Spinactinospora alkalitolerans]
MVASEPVAAGAGATVRYRVERSEHGRNVTVL